MPERRHLSLLRLHEHPLDEFHVAHERPTDQTTVGQQVLPGFEPVLLNECARQVERHRHEIPSLIHEHMLPHPCTCSHIPVRTGWDKQPNRDKLLVLRISSVCLCCLSHLYIGDKYRQLTESNPSTAPDTDKHNDAHDLEHISGPIALELARLAYLQSIGPDEPDQPAGFPDDHPSA